MSPDIKLRKKHCRKSILDLHETIFHEIFQFLDHHTIFLRLRSVCRTIKTYADNFVQLGGVLMFLGHQSSDLLQVYKLKQNVIFISIQSIKPYPASDEIITYHGDTFGGIFNRKVVAGTFMKSKEGLWAQEAYEQSLCPHMKKVYWPCELMLQTLYEYNPKENEWIRISQIDRSSTITNSYILYEQFFRITWYPIGNVCLILVLNNKNPNKYMMASSSTSFTDPLIITPEYHYKTIYDVNLKQSLDYALFFNEELRSYLNIPYEIYTLRNFDIVRVAANKLMVVGGYSSLGSNFWLWQGELTKEGSLIEWTRKYNLEGIRDFNLGYPFCFKLGDGLYFIGHNKKRIAHEDGLGQPYLSRKLYCDRYDLKEEKYKTNVHKVPSSFHFGPKIVLKCQNDTFVLITTGLAPASTFIFTPDKGFEDAPKIIFSKEISLNPLLHLFYQTYYPIKIM